MAQLERPSGVDAGARSSIIDAALADLGELDFVELLRSVTPERLARHQLFSASTVRYHFGRSSGGFDREGLAAALVSDLCAALTAQAQSAAAGYLRAVEMIRAGEGREALEQALANDLESFTPGAGGPEATSIDRLYLLTVAMCDNSGSLSAAIRSARESVLMIYDGVYEKCLEASGRTLAEGTTLRELTLTINAFLEGLMVLGRQQAWMSVSSIADAILRIFWAFTVNAPPEEDPAEALLSSMRASPG